MIVMSDHILTVLRELRYQYTVSWFVRGKKFSIFNQFNVYVTVGSRISTKTALQGMVSFWVSYRWPTIISLDLLSLHDVPNL